MAGTTRIPKTELTGLRGGLIKRMSRKMMGEVPEAAEVMWHNRKVFMDTMVAGRKAEKWNRCDHNLKYLAHMAVAAFVGCSFCLDLGYFMANRKNLDEAKVRQVPRWREAEVFTRLERDVMEYAEAMSQTPLNVTDELSARLLKALGAPAMVELTAFIAMSNMGTRMNIALGIESQGFSTSCALPPMPPMPARS